MKMWTTVFLILAMIGGICFWSFGKKTDKGDASTEKPRVEARGHYSNVKIPKEKYTMVDINIDSIPYVGMFNATILDVKPKIVFRWFLSLAIAYKKTVGDDMPDNEDTVKMQDFCDLLDKNLKRDPRHQNAVFLGRLTGNGQTQVMWYVNNPELANTYLQNLISSEEYPFDFNFEMYEDEEWKEAKYWLKPLPKSIKKSKKVTSNK